MVGESLEKFKIPIALSIVGAVLIIGGMLASNLTGNKTEDFPKESLTNSQKIITVDVSGAVKRAGVYKLPVDSRIEDAIEAAGGFSDIANREYISKYLNLAQKITDGIKVYIPFTGESSTALLNNQAGLVSGSNVGSKVNINTSTQAELESLPGIGPVTASKIISARPYQSIDQLQNKKIVTKSVFEKIKDSVVVY